MAALTIAATACGGAGGATGSAQIFVSAEDSIPDGLAPGEDVENIRDGWTLSYDTFLVTIGNFRASRTAAPEDAVSDATVSVVDLRNAPAGGLVLATFDGLAAARWDRFGFDLPNATATAVRAGSLSEADHDLMVSNGWSVYVAGRITKPDGSSCRPGAPADCVERTAVTFRWGFAAGTSFDDCAPQSGDTGFAVPAGGTAQLKPTIHGDHWAFTNITQGVEITERRVQWIADADLDRDGETTLEELRNVQAADVFPSPTYNLSGAVGGPVQTAYDYALAQARTLGDFQGDGECPTRAVLP